MIFRFFALSAAILLLTACDGGRSDSGTGSRDGASPKAADTRVVVAVIDSGINPYHEYFRAGGPLYDGRAPSSVTPEVLAEFGIDASHIIDLTITGNPEADFAADEGMWDRLRDGEIYWFRGTNILAVSMESGGRNILPDDDADTHGVGTSASVLAGNPDAIVLFIEGINAEAETLAFTHPAVDLITTSYGIPGSPPVPVAVSELELAPHLTNSYTGVVEMGKLHFGASDNSPAISHTDGTSGPWWSVAVAGWEEGDAEGRQATSGSLVDFVADFYREMPYCATCQSGLEFHAGTSFATPYSAGVASRVVYELRQATGHGGGINLVAEQPAMVDAGNVLLTNWDIRRALEDGAYVPGMDEYDPVSGVTSTVAVPVIDAAPWLTIGWGLLTALPEKAVVPATLANLGFGDMEPRTKASEFCTFQSINMEARFLYWNNLAPDSQAFMSSEEIPYIGC